MEMQETKGREHWECSYCNNCYNGCQTKVRIEDGVITRIMGNPLGFNESKLCPRGNAMIMTIYDPNRIRTPMKRTNPEKGIGIDPGWVEISYEEATDILTEKIREAVEINPNLIRLGSMDTHRQMEFTSWAWALGTEQVGWGQTTGGVSCANGVHMLGEVGRGSFGEWTDYNHCKYLILWGGSEGHEAFMGLGKTAHGLAEARKRGMKLVVVDPRLSAAATRADEWIAIRPGTDGALAVAMINVIVNELGIYDEKFLQLHTNAPYLIGPDGLYVRGGEDNKPLIWDGAENKAKTYDDPSIKEYSLTGHYEVNGLKCSPSFQLLKERVQAMSPERAEEITTIPAKTIRHLASDWVEYAQIGSTIAIKGREYPLRPVCITLWRGHNAHAHAFLDSMGIYTLATLVGALDVPGSMLRVDAFHITMGVYMPVPPGEDGMTENQVFMYGREQKMEPIGWPPKRYDLSEYFPVSEIMGQVPFLTLPDPKKYGLPDKGMVSIYHHTNPLFTGADPVAMAEALKNHFVCVCDIFLSETAELADLVFPEPTFLERYVTQGAWHWSKIGRFLAHPVIEPLYGLKDFMDVLIEVGDRVGTLYGENGMYNWINTLFQLQPSFALDLNKRHSFKDIAAHICENSTNGEKDFQWFIENGLSLRDTEPFELYQPYGESRVPLYYDFFLKIAEEAKDAWKKHQIDKHLGFEWDFSDYVALPEYKPSPMDSDAVPPEYDLYAISYRTTLSSYGRGIQNPWLEEQLKRDPFGLNIMIHQDTAAKKGLNDGDIVWVEGWRARRTKGRIKVTQGIQKETIAMGSIFGHWAKHSIGYGKGPHYNSLVPLGLEFIDKVCTTWENVRARVRIYKA